MTIYLLHHNIPQDLDISTIPGDKSISHRAVILGSLANNKSQFKGFLCAEDCLNTVSVFQKLGVPIDLNIQEKTLSIQGVGLSGLREPSYILDTGNSGTGIRLITGVLAAQSFPSQLTGDASIQNRPMKRIIEPLKQMGALITGQTKEENPDLFPPLSILPSSGLSSIQYTLPVVSAQVKSCLLLASLFIPEKTVLIEKEKTRDHTEVMLKSYGANIQTDHLTLSCIGQTPLKCPSTDPLTIPADFSSAAFFIVLSLLSNTSITLQNIGINKTRSALITVLQQMGANIQVTPLSNAGFEPIATLSISPSSLHNITIDPKMIPIIIDEIPILAIAAVFSSGTLSLRKAKELRVKESDRITSIVNLIKAMGGDIQEYEDGFDIHGSKTKIQPFHAHTFHDHRIAMSACIAASIAKVKASLDDIHCIQTSFPNFFNILSQFGTTIHHD